MTGTTKNANRFLFVYLILYLCLTIIFELIPIGAASDYIVPLSPVVLGLLYLLITRQNPVKALQIRPFRLRSLPLVILYTFFMWPLMSLLSVATQLFTKNLVTEVVLETLTKQGIVLSLITMALIPAFAEEFVFRGIYYGGIKNAHPILAIFLSAFCFGMMHMNFNQFSYAFFMGICLVLVLEATGSILASFLMHMTFNATSIITNYINKPDISDTVSTIPEIKQALVTLAPFAAIGTLLGIITLMIIAKQNKRKLDLTHNGEKMITLPLIGYFIITFGMCMLSQIVD